MLPALVQIAAETIAGHAKRFEVTLHMPPSVFLAGVALRQPLLILAMLWFSMCDKL